jgi:hypothetical protein
MMRFLRPRLRKPVGIALAGTAYAAAWLVHGGNGWAGKVTMFAAFAGVTIAVAARADWWWPFAVIFAITGFNYLLGLSTYGVGEEVPADDENDGRQVRFPVSH